MIPARELDSSNLHDIETSPLATELGMHFLQIDYAMDDTLNLQIRRGGRTIIEDHYGTVSAGKKLFERQHLPAVFERSLGEHSHLRYRIKNNTGRLDAFNLGQQ